MMDITDSIEGVKNALGDRLSAQVAYGEPIQADGVTVIPVARVMLGFGAGGGVGEPVLSGNGEDAAAPRLVRPAGTQNTQPTLRFRHRRAARRWRS